MKIPTTTDIPQRYTWCLAGICYSSLAILPSFLSYAESYFNPAFLLENGTSVADLSRFERGNHQPDKSGFNGADGGAAGFAVPAWR